MSPASITIITKFERPFGSGITKEGGEAQGRGGCLKYLLSGSGM